MFARRAATPIATDRLGPVGPSDFLYPEHSTFGGTDPRDGLTAGAAPPYALVARFAPERKSMETGSEEVLLAPGAGVAAGRHADERRRATGWTRWCGTASGRQTG